MPVRVWLPLITLVLLSACATQRQIAQPAQTEAALRAANFVELSAASAQVRDKAEKLPPYELTALPSGKKGTMFYFANPARQTVLVGDLKQYENFSAIQQDEATMRGLQALQKHQSDQFRSRQARERAAQVGQAVVVGLAGAGAAMAAAATAPQPIYQAPLYQSSPVAPPQAFQPQSFSPPSQRSVVYPTLPNSGIRDYSRGAVGIVENGKVYPTLPNSTLRDYSRGAVGVVE